LTDVPAASGKMKKIEAFKNGQKMRDLVTLIQTSHFSPKKSK